MSTALAFVGKIKYLDSIPDSCFICSATVVCGCGGIWKGVVRLSDFKLNDRCVVFLPDAILPDLPKYSFMKSRNMRVRICRFRGAESEVLILPWEAEDKIGTNLTELLQITKYHKPIPANLNGKSIGGFPSVIPKTDEPNYQRRPDLVNYLRGKPYYITLKMDGSSCTAYKYKGHFGVCSRNLELVRNEDNGYWKIVAQNRLEEKLPEGFAVQFEACGPGVHSNPCGLDELQGFAFNIYDIKNHAYLDYDEMKDLLHFMRFPFVPLIEAGAYFNQTEFSELAKLYYGNGKPAEGVVVRSQANVEGHKPISFKIINLEYKD